MNLMHDRTAMLLGEDKLELLSRKHVLVFGLGGVGGHAVEALCRGGIGKLTLIDCESFDLSNCNRQIFATRETLGQRKTDVAKKRLFEIAPECSVKTLDLFYSAQTEPENLFDGVDYILDAIDSVPSKLHLIERANELQIPIISCMGTGNKLDPTVFRVCDLYQTKVCPLARKMRMECKKRGIDSLKVVYSEETPQKPANPKLGEKTVPGSVSFVPGVAGMILAGEIIKDLIK